MNQQKHMELTPQEFTRRLEENPLLWQQIKNLFNQPAPTYITYEEFLNTLDEDILAEWVNGEVIMTSPASRKYQLIGDFLLAVLKTFTEFHQLGLVISPPFQMKLTHSGREPDLIFIAQAHLSRLQETYLDGPADLVIEIISPESLERDRGTKFYEYEAEGIPEYWLIDPLRQTAEMYCLNPDKVYQPVFTGKEGIYHAQVIPGFWFQVEWLWQSPLLPVLDTLRALQLI
jgi:Uma2 family endonuclease